VSLSPDDIVGYEFRQQTVRGYDVQQVDDLLDQLADQVERTERELDDLRQRLRDSEARLAAALETESTLKRTLVTAQDAAERALAEAREQADELRETAERAIDEQLARAREEARTVVSDAQRDARAELTTAREQRAAIEDRLAGLRELEQRHRKTLERHLRVHLDQLEQLASDPGSPTNLPAPAPDQRPGGQPPTPATWDPYGSDDDEPSTAGSDHGLTVRVRGAEQAGSGEQQVGSSTPPNGGEGEPHT
jgi:DivIVA domain-containing protein